MPTRRNLIRLLAGGGLLAFWLDYTGNDSSDDLTGGVPAASTGFGYDFGYNFGEA